MSAVYISQTDELMWVMCTQCIEVYSFLICKSECKAMFVRHFNDVQLLLLLL